MKAELRCEDAAVEISARLDGELDRAAARRLDSHLEVCARCRTELASLARVRRVVRAQPAEPVPDLIDKILERVAAEGSRRPEWVTSLRLGIAAATVSALVIAGASLPWSDSPPETAAASEIVERVYSAARALDTYRATYSIVETGWDPAVPTRRFRAQVTYEAPEKFVLSVADQTDYPPSGEWTRNDVDLIASPRGWWIREPVSCPAASGSMCREVPVEQRSLIDRQPFDQSIALPTDIILPLETLASATGVNVAGVTEVAGREAHEVTLSYGRAQPLVKALQPGGSWRGFYAGDRVHLFLDANTWFPLGFDVTADTSPDRAIWTRRHGLTDKPGQRLLSVRAQSFAQPSELPAGTFAVPQQGVVATGGFSRRRAVALERTGFAPEVTLGLEPYRMGTSELGEKILSYAEGMEWLRVVITAPLRNPTNTELRAAEIDLGSREWAYYEPSTEAQGRRLVLHSHDARVQLESNLPRASLLEVAGSINARGLRLPDSVARGAFHVERVAYEELRSRPAALLPSFLPKGYEPTSALVSTAASTKTVTVYYQRSQAEFDGLGIRLTEIDGVEVLPPSAEQSVTVRGRGGAVRWFPERGEIDWLEGDLYTVISAPSLDLATMLRIAQGLQ